MEPVAHVEKILRIHPQTRIGTNGLAQDLHLSRFQLYRRVKAQTGISPKKLAGKNRIEQACELLRETSMSIADIAEEVGIDDANYFARFFRRRTGFSPSLWRKQNSVTPLQRVNTPINRIERIKSADDLPVHLL